MLEIKNTQVYGLDNSIRVSGFPKATFTTPEDAIDDPLLTTNDVDRAKRLGKVPTGTGHDCFLKGIIVQGDMKWSHYFDPQLQRYKFFDIVSSQSKMHKLHEIGIVNNVNKYVWPDTVVKLEAALENYKTITDPDLKYEAFMAITSNLPLGYELWLGFSTNYLQLKTMYKQRKNEKLKEDWGNFCNWCETLPLFKELIGVGV